MKRRPTLAGLTMMLVVALAACGGGPQQDTSGHGGGKDTGSYTVRQDDTAKVTGVRDGVRHVTRRTTRATRPHLVRKCGTESRKVKHTKRSHGRKRTYYTTKKVRDCHKVRRGTERYTRVLRSEHWCVRLDDVNGKRTVDDQWFRVNSTVYGRVQGEDDRAKVTIEPLRKGC
ncbi:hypothetical protein OG746_17780 [Streptomyces sp. NBC_01016]|uniref:hypothetical protein n=1 Tax=Streptomyces sp. NBC_01016 TaxID=2903720 RepID=UPI00224CE31D|nr:hypothetical protein [Streptomyces sp. NBC_01016]MCX4830580.1 hypothetical protein [Streptomyces sp. NBC_01016]